MTKRKTIIRIVHGSHLYNLNHINSDLDTYEIYDLPYQYRPKKQAKQTIDADSDRFSISLNRFRSFVHNGTPQAIETLFAGQDKWLEVDSAWHDIRRELHEDIKQRAITSTVINTYKRTIENFMLKDEYKKNRHAFRLIFNIKDFIHYRYFNPSLNAEQIELINKYADLSRIKRYDKFIQLSNTY